VVPILPVFYPYTQLAGLDLTVEGIRMPPIEVARTPPVEEAPVVVPPEVPQIYVPPERPRKPDRN